MSETSRAFYAAPPSPLDSGLATRQTHVREVLSQRAGVQATVIVCPSLRSLVRAVPSCCFYSRGLQISENDPGYVAGERQGKRTQH